MASFLGMGQHALHEGIEIFSMSYEVHVDGLRESFESLSTRLVEAVNTGEFDTLLQQAAARVGGVAVDDKYTRQHADGEVGGSRRWKGGAAGAVASILARFTPLSG
jgi:hypothetical protein